MPCNNCSACLMNDCGGCKFCLDKRKFGGPGKLKKRCEMRQCVIPKKVGGSTTTSKGSTIATTTTFVQKKQPEIRNKFLASVEMEDSDMNSSFDDSFSSKTIGDESPTLAADQKASLQSYIFNGLETFEVVTVTPAEDKPCYICKTNTNEDLFYCSSCYDPFHPFCLHMQNLPQPKEPQSGSLCSRCVDDGKGDYEQDMNARAKSIDAKCEEINGKQYQVISFLSEPEQEKLNQESVLLEQVFMSEPLPVPTSFGLQSLNELPQSYDVDFDKYLQTNGLAISLQE
eukprot:GFUD01010458.1.p1 GENE.GFUD01010458.1~~GFUD01010458.1.p1  ORF type:complete len:285 (+),score=64.81 GFUD01010458.1:342-1196(+)